MSILRVTQAFAVLSSGRVYSPGDLVEDADPVVKKVGLNYFEPVEVAASRAKGAGAVEQATAAPGERRSISKPRGAKRAAPKTDGKNR